MPIKASDAPPAPRDVDVVIRDGAVYDGSGATPFIGDLAFDADRIVYLGPHFKGRGREEIAARGLAVAPGFINMLSHAEDSFLADGRALSDLRQGVTLEVLGEGSMGPRNAAAPKPALRETGTQAVTWTTLGEYLELLERRGIAPNVASFVGAGTVREYVLGERDVAPSTAELEQMRVLVREAMQEGAMGVTTALIYSPADYANTAELVALAAEAGRCGGIYSAHMRSEGDKLVEGVQETLEIVRESGAPAEIYHLKAAGQANWPKLDVVIRLVESARARGMRITADMYPYTAGATALDAVIPPWAHEGGRQALIERLRNPVTRKQVVEDMRSPATTWENLYRAAGPSGMVLLAFNNPQLHGLAGKSLADVAAERDVDPEDAAVDLVIQDGGRVEVAYALASEDNVRREIRLPWVSFGSDADAPAPEGAFLSTLRHPRAYGTFARVLGTYVRDQKLITLQDAIRKLTSLPAATLSISQRGALKEGNFADVVLFDPRRIQDHATYEQPHQLSTGVDDVWVNGARALHDGQPTGAASGRVVRGRGWVGEGGGGCRASSRDWTWAQ